MTSFSTADVPDIPDQRVIVTGANSGIGKAAANVLAAAGAQVTLAVRNVQKGQAAAATIAGKTEVRELDLASLDSIRRFATDWDGDIHLLINNAGVMAPSARRTAEGFELQFGTNHLGHFALTGRLLPLLLASEAPRVVTVSSMAHRSARSVWTDETTPETMPESALGFLADAEDDAGRRKRTQARWTGYARSKLANLLFARELDRRAKAASAPLVSVAAHPGYAATELLGKTAYSSRSKAATRLSDLIMRLTAQSSATGAWPSLYGATVADLSGGEYIGPRGPGEFRGAPAAAKMSRAARDDVAAKGLWEYSVSVTGVGYEELAS